VQAEAVAEALITRNLIARELWDRLDTLKKCRPHLKGKDAEGKEVILVESALDAKLAEAEREILEALMKNASAVEDLMQLRRPRGSEGDDEGGKTAIVALVIDAQGATRKILLRPETTRMLAMATPTEDVIDAEAN
jgi:hypothetical protein